MMTGPLPTRLGHRHQSGVNIVELMIAMTLSIVLLGSVAQVFFATKTTYRTQETMSRIQENARYTLGQLTADLQSAGFTGCIRSTVEATSNVTSLLNVTAPSDDMFDFSHAIWGTDNGTTGNDELIIRYADSRTELPVKEMASSGTGFDFDAAYYNALPTDDRIEQWDVVGVTDCGQTLVFLVTGDPAPGGADGTVAIDDTATSTDSFTNGLSNTIVPAEDSLSVPPGDDPLRQSAIYRLNAVRYFVDTNPNATTGRSGRTLYRQAGNNAAQPLVDGIQVFALQYGLDTDADGTVDGDFRDWDDLLSNEERQSVMAVRVTMQINDGRPILDESTSSVGVTLKTAEFKQISTTIRLRNRFGGT